MGIWHECIPSVAFESLHGSSALVGVISSYQQYDIDIGILSVLHECPQSLRLHIMSVADIISITDICVILV